MPGPVVVTGVGLATSLGFGVGENWRRLVAGEPGIALLDPGRFPVPLQLPVRLGAMVSRERLAERIRAAVPRGVWNTSADVCHLWLLVALEALARAGLAGGLHGSVRAVAPSGEEGRTTDSAAARAGSSSAQVAAPQAIPAAPPSAAPAGAAPTSDGARVGIFVGNGAGAATFTEQEYANIHTAGKAHLRDVSRMAVPKYMMSSLAGQLSILIGARGPAITVNTACSSGATALVLALDALRAGRVDRAVAGGADLALAGAVLKGFANLAALSLRNDLGAAASRPFDAARDGFVLGEGAACLVLERPETARARGARVLARLAGGAASSEAHNLLSPREHGEAMAECMREALRDAGTRPAEVRHVYAHGTGTPLNDRCEAQAIEAVLPGRPTVSATKALLGHTLGAAGAIDAVLAAYGLGAGEVVPCRNLDTLDVACAIRPARSVRLAPSGPPALSAPTGPLVASATLVNSFAFGGHNATLVLTPDG
jgi:3-oxoacyl-[acyl-carrier-protein] synthase II